jgi:hypothetical protein
MPDTTVFPIPQAPSNYNKLGKKLMIHDLTQPEITSTKLINFEETTHTEVTYAELTNLISTSQLIKGQFYVLIDFETIYDQMDFDNSGNLKSSLVTKTGTIERIWLLALNENTIADKAYSETFPNDEIKYDVTYSSTFVNGSPAKGRISERIDENNNRTDYDHREIKFIRYDDGAGNFTIINDNGNASGEFLTFVQNFTGGNVKDNWLGDFYSIGAFFGQEYGNNVFIGNRVVDNTSLSLFYNNTFSGVMFINQFSGHVRTNQFSRDVNNNQFIGDLENNQFSGDVSANQFIGDVNNNQFSGDMYANQFSGHVSANQFSGDVNNNQFSGGVASNTFTHTNPLQYCTIASTLSNKTIDETTYPILFGIDYKKEILKGSDNNDYIKTFDGTIDQYILIP